mmetsp:Transcript_3703/g.8320  ORF Transcript_3703/g.8320 Transcript_3703/m.8320 type:complete len:301 (-) Transcript_3703:170-1072(-)
MKAGWSLSSYEGPNWTMWFEFFETWHPSHKPWCTCCKNRLTVWGIMSRGARSMMSLAWVIGQVDASVLSAEGALGYSMVNSTLCGPDPNHSSASRQLFCPTRFSSTSIRFHSASSLFFMYCSTSSFPSTMALYLAVSSMRSSSSFLAWSSDLSTSCFFLSWSLRLPLLDVCCLVRSACAACCSSSCALRLSISLVKSSLIFLLTNCFCLGCTCFLRLFLLFLLTSLSAFLACRSARPRPKRPPCPSSARLAPSKATCLANKVLRKWNVLPMSAMSINARMENIMCFEDHPLPLLLDLDDF